MGDNAVVLYQQHHRNLSGVYLAPLGALGLTLYLMRGWELILWITFIGFWYTFPSFAATRPSQPLTAIVVSWLAIGAAACRRECRDRPG